MENDLGVNLIKDEVNLNDLISELLQGRDTANCLHISLNNAPLSSSTSQQVLVNKIMSSFDNALCMLNHHGGRTIASSDSDHELKRDASCRRRCRRALWTDQVHVNPGAGLEEAHGDGYSWRKYGQKNIHGAKFPRGYYRCTYRDSKDCSARKLIQQSDEDPTIFNVCYKGSHTCSNQNPTPLATHENQEPTSMLQIQQQENNNNNNSSNLKVTTDNNGGHDDEYDNSFHYCFSDIGSSSGVFKVGVIDCGFMPQTLFGNTSFVPPAAATCSTTTTNVNNVGGTQYVVTSEVEMEIPTLAGTDSPVVGMEFSPFNDAVMDFYFDNDEF